MEAALVMPLKGGRGRAHRGACSRAPVGRVLNMLTLAFAQIVWPVIADDFTHTPYDGRSGPWLAEKPSVWITVNWLALVCRRRVSLNPEPMPCGAGDSPPRSRHRLERQVQPVRFHRRRRACGVGAVCLCWQHLARITQCQPPVDGLVMVLLGGIQTPGPGRWWAPSATPGCTTMARSTDHGARCWAR